MLSLVLATTCSAARMLGVHELPREQVPSVETQLPTAPVAQPALVPGQLPPAASEKARAEWLALCKATSGEKPQPKVAGFDLHFEGRSHPGGRETHDFNDARYRYLEPGWIATSLEGGALRVRGPAGDYFIKDGIATRLQGADFVNDVRELDEQARVAHSFVSLIDPRAMRLASLALAKEAPQVLPPSLVERAKQLRWLEITSPDFQSDPKKPELVLVRAWIGVDAGKHLPELAVVARDDNGTIVHETALLVKLDKWAPLDGFQVPGELRSFSPDLTRSPWAFAEAPSLTLFRTAGSLRPPLTETDFLPPAKH